MRIAAIDQGSTSTRSLLVNDAGRVEVVCSIEHRQLYPHEGWVEHDPEELIRNIRLCADAVGTVDAIGIDNQGESCLAWDAVTKEALSNVIVWQDNRTIDVIDTMKSNGHEQTTLQRAGLPLDPYFSAGKLSWIIRNNQKAAHALAQGTLRLGTTDAFFLDRLTDHFVTDITTASRTSLMNIHQLQWDETLCTLFGVPIECLPKIVASTGHFGTLKTQFCTTSVTASIVDQQAALYGFGCRNKGDTKMTFGTGAFALMLTGRDIVNKPESGLLPTVAWQKENQDPVFAVDGGVYTASAALNWAKSLGLFSRFSDINSFHTPSAIETGLAFVPALTGLGCPHWDAHARGTWLGLALNHKPEQLVQSILEGVAFRAAEVINAMDDCVAINGPLLVDGGMSNNRYFLQFLANILAREVRPSNVPELTGLGTILLAADYIGHKPNVVSLFGSIQPHPSGQHLIDTMRSAIDISRRWVHQKPNNPYLEKKP